MVYYLSLVLMLKQCLLIRLYQYQLITLSFLNRLYQATDLTSGLFHLTRNHLRRIYLFCPALCRLVILVFGEPCFSLCQPVFNRIAGTECPWPEFFRRHLNHRSQMNSPSGSGQLFQPALNPGRIWRNISSAYPDFSPFHRRDAEFAESIFHFAFR